MGNQIIIGRRGSGKIILPDGRVENLNQAITVAELMLDHPQHVVMEFDTSPAAAAEKTKIRPKPLPADHKLDNKKTYLMLPTKTANGKIAAPSSEQVRRVFSSVNAALRSSTVVGNKYVTFLPWLAKVCPAEAVVGPDAGRPAAEEGVEMERADEYLSRQLSGRGWRPSLDTIKEITVKRKDSHWLF